MSHQEKTRWCFGSAVVPPDSTAVTSMKEVVLQWKIYPLNDQWNIWNLKWKTCYVMYELGQPSPQLLVLVANKWKDHRVQA